MEIVDFWLCFDTRAEAREWARENPYWAKDGLRPVAWGWGYRVLGRHVIEVEWTLSETPLEKPLDTAEHSEQNANRGLLEWR